MQKNLIKKYPTKFLATSTAVIALLIFVTPRLGSAAYVDYVEPTATFPNYDPAQIPNLLNGSLEPQTMEGNLYIGLAGTSACPTGQESGCSRLCLNAQTIPGGYPNTDDRGTITAACISSWGDLSGMIVNSQNSVRKLNVPTHIDNGSVTDDTVDNGAVSLQANATNGQLISLMAVAPDSSGSANYPTAISADGGANQYAATFGGRLAVMSDSTRLQELCLNDTGTGTNCRGSWSELLVDFDPNIVRLQKLQIADPSRVADSGLTAVSGILVANSMVAGSPIATTLLSQTCGNGICDTINGETVSQCSSDCANP